MARFPFWLVPTIPGAVVRGKKRGKNGEKHAYRVAQ